MLARPIVAAALLAGLALAAPAAAQEAAARWIDLARAVAPSASARPLIGRWFALRRTFELAGAPRAAPARVAVDSKYWLWVNGELAVFEGGLKRGPRPGASYADTVDLAPYLAPGTNTLAVLVWYFGKDGFSHADSGAPGLFFEARLDERPLASDGEWRAREHPAYGPTGAPRPNYRLPESNVRFDARDDIEGWAQPGHDDSGWPRAVLAGAEGDAPWGELVERPIPQWRVGALASYVDAPAFPLVADGELLSLALPYNCQFTPWLDVEAPGELAGATIDLRTDDYEGGGAPNVRAEYVLRAGRQEFESLGWMNGHQMRYAVPAGVTVHGLGYRESGYDASFTPGVVTGDPLIDAYCEKARRTQYLCMRDTFMDCPDRERAQWWGDVVLQMGQVFYAFDTRSHLLARKAVLELAGWQRADGTLYSPVPSGNWNKELPLQMLASVGRGFWDYYLQTGDRETLERVYPAARRYVLDVWGLIPEGEEGAGLVRPRAGEWLWVDWGENQDVPVLMNAWYAIALVGLNSMAVALERPEDTLETAGRARTLMPAFHAAFWDEAARCYRSREHTGPPDDRAQALAHLSGLSQAERSALREVLTREHHAGPYMESYVLEALFEMGYAEDALARLRRRYREMVEHPATTLWEDWAIGGDGGGTIDHAWAGGAYRVLASCAAGVRPLTAGYATFQVAPRLGELARIELTMDTVRGPIHVAVERRADGTHIALDAPEDTLPRVHLPVQSLEHVRARRSADAAFARLAPLDVVALERRGGECRITVPGGRWEFLALDEQGR